MTAIHFSERKSKYHLIPTYNQPRSECLTLNGDLLDVRRKPSKAVLRVGKIE